MSSAEILTSMLSVIEHMGCGTFHDKIFLEAFENRICLDKHARPPFDHNMRSSVS